MSISDCQCPYLIVSLANEALAHQFNRQGTYQLSEEINGKPSWKSGTEAIWYYPDFKEWAIGPLSDIGTSNRGISSKYDGEYDCPQQVPEWSYWDGTEWQNAGSNDVSLQCTGTK